MAGHSLTTKISPYAMAPADACGRRPAQAVAVHAIECRPGPVGRRAISLAREVGRSIRALRRRRGLTQSALAELIDRSEVALRAIERGASAPSFTTLERLMVALDVPAAGLFPTLRKDDAARPETERRAREVAAVTALAHGFDDHDLTLALALLSAVAKAATERGQAQG